MESPFVRRNGGDAPRAENAEEAPLAVATSAPPSWRMIALRVGATLVVITLVTLAIRKMDLAALRGALDSAGLASLVVASLFSLTMLVAKAAYWRTDTGNTPLGGQARIRAAVGSTPP